MATVDRPLAATDVSRPKADSAPVSAASARTPAAGLNDSGEFFSNLFASARLARQREADRTRQADQAQQQTDDAGAYQDSVDHAESKDAAHESTLQEASQARPTRQDRARDAVRRDAKRETLSKTDAAEAAAQPAPTQPAPGARATELHTASSESFGTPGTTGQTPTSISPEQIGISGSAQNSNETVTLSNPGNGIWSPAAASAAPANPMPTSTTPALSAEGVTPNGTANAPAGAVSVPAVSPADSIDAAKAVAAKSAADPKSTDGQAKPNATTSTFEPVLQAAARTRGQLAARVASPNAAEAIKPDEAEGIEKLARIIRTSSKDGQSKMVLRLDPPELGQVRIDARMQDGALTVRMEAQTQAGHDALKSRLSELRGALEQQGIHVQQVDVDLRPPQSQPSQHDQNAWQPPSQQQGTPSNHSQQHHDTGRQSPADASGTSNAFSPATQESASADPPSAGVIPWYSRQLNLVA